MDFLLAFHVHGILSGGDTFFRGPQLCDYLAVVPPTIMRPV
jgi:hypothetical protein